MRSGMRLDSISVFLSFSGIPVTITSMMNLLATRYIKSWLGLSRSTTVAVIHHPSILIELSIICCIAVTSDCTHVRLR